MLEAKLSPAPALDREPDPKRSNVLLFVPRPPLEPAYRGQGQAERVDLTVARVVGELEDLRRRTGGRGPRWRKAVAAVQMFAATLGGAVADLTTPHVVDDAVVMLDVGPSDNYMPGE